MSTSWGVARKIALVASVRVASSVVVGITLAWRAPVVRPSGGGGDLGHGGNGVTRLAAACSCGSDDRGLEGGAAGSLGGADSGTDR